MIMEAITLGKLTDRISLLSQEALKLLNEGNLRKAAEKYDEMSMLVYNFRKVSEALETSTIA